MDKQNKILYIKPKQYGWICVLFSSQAFTDESSCQQILSLFFVLNHDSQILVHFPLNIYVDAATIGSIPLSTPKMSILNIYTKHKKSQTVSE